MNRGGAIGVQLDDYYNPKTGTSLEIQLTDLHSIELWTPRNSTNSFNTNIKFPENPCTTESLVKPLEEQLSFVYGDSSGMYEVLYKYYKAKSRALENQLRQAKKMRSWSTAESKKSDEEHFIDMLKAELNNDKLDPLVME